MSDVIRLDVASGYDRWSEIYDQDLNPLVLLEEPLVHEWMGPVQGLHVADVGCGTGRHTLWLAQAGAVIDAYEASAGMLARAKQKLQTDAVRWTEHQLPNPLPVAQNTYDLVVFALVADHLEALDKAFAELHRVLKPSGRLIFTVLHPAMNLKGITARFHEPDTAREVRVQAYEHTYADYVMAVLSAGFKIAEIKELKADPALCEKTPRAEKYLGWPMLLAIRLAKNP